MKSVSTPIDRWETFLLNFFRAPNDLHVGSSSELDRILASARAAVSASDPLPVIVPIRIGKSSEYVAVSFSPDQSRELRNLLVASVGVSWTAFDGRPLSQAELNDPLNQAAIALAGGDANLVYRFSVVANGRPEVRSALNRLMQLLREAPKRQASINAPLGRVIGDFNDACGLQRRETAQALLDQLSNDHRISATNRLFLRVQFLATFEDWDELESIIQTTDLLQLSIPALVADALARFGMRTLTNESSIGEVQEVLGKLGALVTSMGMIRSRAGAAYLALRCLLQGEGQRDFLRRLDESGWDLVGYEWILKLWSGSSDVPGEQTPSLTAVQLAVQQGRLDAAVEMLLELPVDVKLLRVILDLIPQVFSEASFALLARYRDSIDALVEGKDLVKGADDDEHGVSRITLHQALIGIFRSSSSQDDCSRFSAFLVEYGVATAMRPGALREVTSEIEALLNGPHAELALERGVDACLDLVSALRQTRAEPDSFKDFGLVVLATWAYSDGTSDRRRMSRVLELVEDLLDRGIDDDEYLELIEILRSCWRPFLTDRDAHLGIEMIETLVAHSPAGLEVVRPFAMPILSRIDVHNVRRIDADVVSVVKSLANEFGIDLRLSEDFVESIATEATRNVTGSVFIYSLLEDATARAIDILQRRYPELRFDSCDDKVATKRMGQLTRNADLVVIVDRASTHAATDAIRDERARRQISYASGRGSTSIIRAVAQWCDQHADRNSA